MGTVVHIECKQARHAAEQSVWALTCETQGLQRLANEGATFFPGEIEDMRRAASDLLMIAAQVEHLQKLGSK